MTEIIDPWQDADVIPVTAGREFDAALVDARLALLASKVDPATTRYVDRDSPAMRLLFGGQERGGALPSVVEAPAAPTVGAEQARAPHVAGSALATERRRAGLLWDED